jgi:hypothetical protein
MSTERIKELAEQADLDWHKHWNDDESNKLEKFAGLIAAEEREACAMEAEYEAARWPYAPECREPCKSIATAIRARGNE